MYFGILGLFFVFTMFNASARTLHRAVRQPITVSSEAEDLVRTTVPPKRLKNASGKSNEGAYYKTYSDDANGEKGYTSNTFGKGEHGYKTLDTFHKQAGDKYGFEEHLAFGKPNKKGDDGSSGEGDKEGDNDYRHYHYTSDDDAPRSNYSMVDADEGSYESQSSYSRNNGEAEGSYDGYGSLED